MRPQASPATSLQNLVQRNAATIVESPPNVIVVSHERSGTHFLMNSLAAAYGYPAADYLDFDQSHLNINYFHPRAVGDALESVGRRKVRSIVKSHHAIDFFDGVLDRILQQVALFYIHRDPVDVMISFWRLVSGWPWHEGPRRPTAVEFAAAQPEGMMMRYQKAQAPSLLQRWARHVDGWTEAAKGRPRLTVVRYDDLYARYAQTVTGFEALLGHSNGNLTPPDRHTNVVKPLATDKLPSPDRAALRALALAEVGDTMRRHGYA